MAIDEHDRHALHTRLDHVLGTAEATTLMEHLPPVGWADVATKPDVEHQTVVLRSELTAVSAELRAEMADLRSALRAEMADLGTDLRSDMADLGTDLRSEMADLGSDLRSDMADLGTDLRSEMAAGFDRLNARLLAFSVSYGVALLGLVGAALLQGVFTDGG